MALFGQGVAEMFKDVVPQSSQGYGDNTIDWANVKPFQVIKPMSSWAATNTGATAPAAPTQATAPQSEYQKWLAQQSGISTSSDGSRDVDRTSGPYGNGTNLSDQQWAETVAARDYAKGLAPVDKVGLGALAQFVMSPLGTLTKIPELSKQMIAAQEETSLFAQMLAADKAAAEINAQQQAEQAGSMMPGMAVAGANTVANPMALDPMQAMQQQQSLQSQQTNSGYDPTGDLSPTGYAADGMGPPSSASSAPDTSSSVGDFSGDVGGRDSEGSGESSGSGGSDGGGKIVCTAMNQAYGFGSYRNAIWLKYSADSLTKAHEVGYHAIFQPLVSYAYNGSSVAKTIVKKTLENIARHRTSDIRAEMRNGKRDIIGRCYRFVLEPLCYVVGKLKGY